MTITRKGALVAIAALALAVRLAFLAADPKPFNLAGLSGQGGEIARNLLVHHRWFAANTSSPFAAERQRRHELVDPADLDYRAADATPHFVAYRIEMPGAALLLALLWAVTGVQRFLPLQLLQVLLDSLAVLLVYRVSLKLFGRPRAALLAAAAYALYLPVAAEMRIPFYDPWALFATLSAVALYVEARGARRPWRWLAAMGIVVGVGVWFRPAVIIVPIALVLADLPSTGWRAALWRGVLPVGIALVILTPYSLWTLTDSGQFTPANVGFGQVLWEGLGERRNSFGAVEDDQATFAMVQRERPGLAYATPAYDAYLRGKALRVIAEHPGFYLAIVGQRFVTFLVPKSDSSRVHRAFAALTNGRLSLRDAAILVVAAIVGPGLLLLVVAGVILTRRRAWREDLLLLGVLSGVFAVPLVLAGKWRYIAPAAFVYLIFAGITVDRIVTWLAERRVPVRQLEPSAASER